jgi:hypothetical protein
VVCSLDTGRFNCRQLWTGNDVDQSGRPEFFASFMQPAGMRDTLRLYMFEAVAEHQYVYQQIDTALIPVSGSGRSVCADLDGDGVDEVAWACTDRIIILKATAPREFERVSLWADIGSSLVCNVGDFNRNGYSELVVGGPVAGGGTKKTVWLEVEAVQVHCPDTVSELRPGDTCLVRWRVYTPPRCDSVSLFLKTDTVVPSGERFWRLDTIATGLAPTESSYTWVVPETTLAWAKILAIAYGPGWQFDESDSAFSITRVGIAAAGLLPPRDWTLAVSPNPVLGRAVVHCDVPVASDVSLSLFDATGRKVAVLASGRHAPGRYSVPLGGLGHDPKSADGFRSCPAPGVHFVRLEAPAVCMSRKVVLSGTNQK